MNTNSHDEWLLSAEQAVKDYLSSHKDPISIEDLIAQINALKKLAERHKPVELKIAALALVNKGDARLNRSWELSLSEGQPDERESAAA